jgi:2-C-methyl-D-erythritol 2,4-cyclodiphosphate synthase
MHGMEMRIGHGYDIHRLEMSQNDGVLLKIGGIEVACGLQAISHSDGDAVMHAVTDALLSAIGEPDIGLLFPDTANENKDQDSSNFLLEAMNRVNEGGWAVGNVSITVVCDQPKIGPIREQICQNLRKYIVAPVHIKGKTHEGTNRIGAMEVHVVALVQRGQHV